MCHWCWRGQWTSTRVKLIFIRRSWFIINPHTHSETEARHTQRCSEVVFIWERTRHQEQSGKVQNTDSDAVVKVPAALHWKWVWPENKNTVNLLNVIVIMLLNVWLIYIHRKSLGASWRELRFKNGHRQDYLANSLNIFSLTSFLITERRKIKTSESRIVRNHFSEISWSHWTADLLWFYSYELRICSFF